jgi:hypothetical protein
MKTEVYSWRLSAERKAGQEAEARREGARYPRCLIVSPPIGSPNAATAIRTTMRNRLRFAGEPWRQLAPLRAILRARNGPVNWLAKPFTESMSRNPMRSPAASAVGLIDTGAILALIDRSDKWHALASRPTTIADCRFLRPKLRSQKFSTSLSAIFAMPAAFGSSCVPARFRCRRSHMRTYPECRP